MPFVLDTVALSEITKKQPDTGFLRWMSNHAGEQAFIAAPSIGELVAGISVLQSSRKRTELESWLDRLLDEFAEHILAFDATAARIWGQAVAAARRSGLTLPLVDAQIAAIAVSADLPVVTRNMRHFDRRIFKGLTVLNPWKADRH